MAPRVGVFVCHCGVNIGAVVDVAAVKRTMTSDPRVVQVLDHRYLCSEAGQASVRQVCREAALDRVVVAACSPNMHEATFRKCLAEAGLNPYQLEIANIREQCSWVHSRDPVAATQKAVALVRSAVENVTRDEPLDWLRLPLVRRALVIGGGLAGMQAALGIADAGHEVVLIERDDRLGGRVASLSQVYPHLRPASHLTDSRIDRVSGHERVRVLTNTVVKAVSGHVGSFRVALQSTCSASDPNGGPQTDIEVGAIVLATGFSLMPKTQLPEYGASACRDVVDALEVERMLHRDGPTGGKILRPSDGREPKEMVWIQCAGSRDIEHGVPYCSKICCMYVAKQAVQFQRQSPGAQAYVFYIDLRAGGKGYEEFVQRAVEQDGVLYIRGKASRMFSEADKVVVWGVDTLTGKHVEIRADLAVLAMAALPHPSARELAGVLHVATDEVGFFSEAHPKLRPLESLTAGVFLAGGAQGPKDIPETVAQASGAASKVLALFARDEMLQEPLIARVQAELCSGCGLCVAACPYEARVLDSRKSVSNVVAALCQGCGACVSACPNNACEVNNTSSMQVMAMVEALLQEQAVPEWMIGQS